MAFYHCSGFTGSLTIPGNVTEIGDYAFECCTQITSCVFEGDAPLTFGTAVFDDCAEGFTIYYLSGAQGFTSPTWNGYPCHPLLAPGDVNGDGAVDTADYILLARYIAGWPDAVLTVPAAADYNGDGIVDGKDRYALARYLAGVGGGN